MAVFLLECKEDEERQVNFLLKKRLNLAFLEKTANLANVAILTEI